MTGRHRSANEELAALVASRAAAEPTPGSAAEAFAHQSSSTLPFLLLRLGSRWFGLRAESVREVVGHEIVSRVPGQPAHVCGVAMIHGRMVPVVALDVLMRTHVAAFADGGETGGTDDGGDQPRARLVVLAAEQLEIAILADDARGVVYLPAAIDAPVDAGRLRFVLGEIPWDQHLVCVLDGAALLAAALAPGPA